MSGFVAVAGLLATPPEAAAGGCTQPPIFAGLTSVTSAGTQLCALDLAWSAATAPCPGTSVRYAVYRSATPGFTPGPANLRQSCVVTTTFRDSLIAGRQYYVVRAEDTQAGGSGPCNGGIEDANLQERSAIPGGPVTTVTDDVESGGTAWDTSGGTGTNVWSIATTASHSPTHAWFWPDPAVVTLQPLTRIASYNVGNNGGRLSWWHRVQTESAYDGYVLEYSLDNGTTWSDILAGQGPVPANLNRLLQNGYNATLSTDFSNPLPGRRAWSGTLGNPGFAEVVADLDDFAGRAVKIRWRAGSDASVAATGIWVDDVALSLPGICLASPPLIQVSPIAAAVDAGGDGVYRPNETVVVAPTWRNDNAALPVTVTGALTNHSGPAGPTYGIPDGAADYGMIPPLSSASCATTGDCYSVANAAAGRPVTHWDSTAVETARGMIKTWTLHVGDSFSDVPPGNPFHRFVETLLHRGVTGGCAATEYCPSASTTRAQMAVFVLIAKEGPTYVPPGCLAGTEDFADVPAASPFCRWVEELAFRGVVAGCGGGTYCPGDPVTREQMSVFVLRTLDPALSPPACVPPNIYADVPETSPFCRWIEELTNRGVVTGCGGGNYCPAAAVTREQMGAFLGVTFGLTLYGL